jgi:flavin reductase (DIM6/NTAB) family NADH-FMN oxidoreductase RutF
MMSTHRDESTPDLTPRELRRCLGQYATGVAVVTYTTDDGPRGATNNSFTSISVDPPLVMVSFARHTNAARYLDHTPFVVNVLASTQLDIALQFAGKPQEGLEVPWSDAAQVPRLRGTVAWLECRPWATHDGGDHLIYLGRVVRHGSRHGEPLVFHRGQFRMVGIGVYDLPRVVQLDGRPLAPWVGHAHRLHEATEPGYLEP